MDDAPARRLAPTTSGTATPVLAWLAEPVTQPLSASRPPCAGGIGLGGLSGLTGDLDELLGRPPSRSSECLRSRFLPSADATVKRSAMGSNSSTASGGGSSRANDGIDFSPASSWESCLGQALPQSWNRDKSSLAAAAGLVCQTPEISSSRTGSKGSVDLANLGRSCSRTTTPEENQQNEDLRNRRLCVGLRHQRSSSTAALPTGSDMKLMNITGFDLQPTSFSGPRTPTSSLSGSSRGASQLRPPCSGAPSLTGSFDEATSVRSRFNSKNSILTPVNLSSQGPSTRQASKGMKHSASSPDGIAMRPLTMGLSRQSSREGASDLLNRPKENCDSLVLPQQRWCGREARRPHRLQLAECGRSVLQR